MKKFIKKIVAVSVESYVTGTYQVLLRTADVNWDYSKFHGELEDVKNSYSSDHSAVLSHCYNEERGHWEWTYAYDWGKRLSDCRDTEYIFSEEALKKILTEEEWNLLMKDEIIEPSQAYIEPHQKRDGYWYPGDYYTRLQVL